MRPSVEGSGFEEEFSDLIELNGYKVAKAARSEDGGSELFASRTDEVGHQVTYVIHLKPSGAAVDEAAVERAARARDRHPGSISVVVSPSSEFARSVVDLADRRGVRLWGEEEIRRLRRNVADKRGLRRMMPPTATICGAGGRVDPGEGHAPPSVLPAVVLCVFLYGIA